MGSRKGSVNGTLAQEGVENSPESPYVAAGGRFAGGKGPDHFSVSASKISKKEKKKALATLGGQEKITGKIKQML